MIWGSHLAIRASTCKTWQVIVSRKYRGGSLHCCLSKVPWRPPSAQVALNSLRQHINKSRTRTHHIVGCPGWRPGRLRCSPRWRPSRSRRTCTLGSSSLLWSHPVGLSSHSAPRLKEEQSVIPRCTHAVLFFSYLRNGVFKERTLPSLAASPSVHQQASASTLKCSQRNVVEKFVSIVAEQLDSANWVPQWKKHFSECHGGKEQKLFLNDCTEFR